ncbi:hypothetical protein BDV12DRAFT_179486 [Aspergillus spectabilis]
MMLLKPQLLSFPPEPILSIFEHLPDLQTLFCAIFACQYFCDFYEASQQMVTDLIISKCLTSHIYEFLDQLRLVIRQDIISRDVALNIFKSAWKLFREKCWEELMPFAKTLAWSFLLKGRRTDAIYILQSIWHGESPFYWSLKTSSRPPLSLRPIGDLLRHLLSEENGDNIRFLEYI